MAVNRIDTSVVEALVRDTLLGVHLFNPVVPLGHTVPAVLIPGDPDPSETVLNSWCRLVRVDVTPRPRVKGDGHTDVADVVVIVNITCRNAALGGPGGGSGTSEAVGQMGQAVAAKLDMVRAADATTGHELVMDRATVSKDPDGDEQRLARTGYITATGVAQRYMADGTGNTVRFTMAAEDR